MTAFRHSGRIGDLIYGLATVKAKGGGALLLNPAPALGFTERDAESLIALLQAQPYISRAMIWEGEEFDIDLDSFRAGDRWRTNLADAHLECFNLPNSERDTAWLTVKEPKKLAPVVFARSLRHHGVPGLWEKIYPILGRCAVFVGTEQEHESFEKSVGQVPYAPVRNLLEMAEIIAGADLFVGNQSAPYAIAEGLKKPAIQESYPAVPNCRFERDDCLAVVSPGDLDGIFEFLWAKFYLGRVSAPRVARPRLGKAALPGASVVVLTYNSAGTIRLCLSSVLESLSADDELIVVDNASRDDTVEIARHVIEERPEIRARLIENKKNLGFSAGCNVGIRKSSGHTVALLNPDTRVWPGWIDGLEARLSDPAVGAAGPLTDYVSGRQFVGWHLTSQDRVLTHQQLWRRVRDRHHGKSENAKLLVGFCIAFRRETLERVGLLDEDLFLGGEDLEMSLRLRLHGFRLAVAREVFVHHAGSKSFLSLESGRAKRLLNESTAVLHRKLARIFGPLPVPKSIDLFGVDILPASISQKEEIHVP